MDLKGSQILNFLILNINPFEQQSFTEKSDLMISLNKDFHKILDKFQRTFQRKFELEKQSKKLQGWYLLSFDEFTKELSKKKIKLSLTEKSEWEDFFIKESKKALNFKKSIDKTDKEIDTMVSQLYNLTDDKIEIIK
jgi:hypothetical protein